MCASVVGFQLESVTEVFPDSSVVRDSFTSNQLVALIKNRVQ